MEKTSDTQFFDGGWCWMAHPHWNNGNAIPVKMHAANGVRYYVPLDPESESDFEWDERDDEWEMVSSPLAFSAIDAAGDLLAVLRRFDYFRDAFLSHAYDANSTTVRELFDDARAAIAKAEGRATGE
jgi:hypothetical protein